MNTARVPCRSSSVSHRDRIRRATGTWRRTPLAPSAYASIEPTRFPAVALNTASGTLSHPWATA